MPFAPEFDDVYKLGIRPACERAGAYAERIDEQLFAESILDRIYNQISKADLIVADLTGRNSNVFYEVGYAHALGKNVVLLTRNAEDIPFDLKHYPHIIYLGRIAELGAELERRVRWAIDNPSSQTKPEGQLELYHDGSLLSEDPLLGYYGDFDEASWNKLKIDVHNPLNPRLQSASFELALLAGHDVHSVRISRRTANRINLGNARYIHVFGGRFSILPGGWEPITLEIRARSRFKVGMVLDLTLRTISEIGVRDYPLRLRMLGLTLDADSDVDLEAGENPEE